MFYFEFHITPKKDSPHFSTCISATVDCWIDFKVPHAAQKIAELGLEERGWTITKLERWVETGIEYYDEGVDDDYSNVVEALETGWSFLYHKQTKAEPVDSGS